MIKNLIKKISFVSFGNILNAGFGVLLLTAAAKNLSLEDFGKYAFLASLLVGLSKIMDFGTNSNYVAISITNDNNDDNLDNALVSLKIILGSVALIISFIVLALFKLLTPTVAILFSIGIVGYGINLTLLPFFHKTEKFQFIVLLNTIPSLIKGFIAVLVFVKLYPATTNTLFGAFSVSMLACSFLAFFLPRHKFNFEFVPIKALNLLKKSISAGISIFITGSFPAVANSIANLVKGFENVGIFSLADKISSVFSLISLSIFTVLLPKNSLKKRNNIKYEIKELFILAGGIISISIVATVALPVALSIIFGQKFAGSIQILNLLIFSSALSAIGSFIENYFYIEGKTTTMTMVSVTKLALFVILGITVVPVFGIVGLAWSHVFVAFLSTTTLFIISLRFH